MFGKKEKNDNTPAPRGPQGEKPKRSGWRKGALGVVFATAVAGGGFMFGLPILEATGVAFRVPANQQAAVTFGGSLSFPGYVAKPGFNIALPGLHDRPVFYRVDQRNMQVDKEPTGAPIATATNDNQLIERVVLDLYFTLNNDRVGDVHMNAQEYTKILNDLSLRVHKEVLGKINISNLDIGNADSNIAAQNLTALRDRINRDMTTALRSAVEETRLAGLVTIQTLQLTDFHFTQTFLDDIENVAREKNRIIAARSQQERVTVEARTAVIQANGERDALLSRAEGTAGSIRIEGEARGAALAAEVVPLSEEGADRLVELRRVEAWGNGGAQVPQILTITNGGEGGASPNVVLDGRNILPLLDGQPGRQDAAPVAPAPTVPRPR